MNKYKHVIWEFVLIIASVLFFRSVWLLMDKYLINLDEDIVLLFSLLIGAVLFGVAVYMLSHDK